MWGPWKRRERRKGSRSAVLGKTGWGKYSRKPSTTVNFASRFCSCISLANEGQSSDFFFCCFCDFSCFYEENSGRTFLKAII